MNVYGYVDNQPLGVVDPLGMAGLAYVSEGFAFRDPDFLARPLGGLSAYSSEQSGIQKDTTAAHFSQSVSPWAESICNSGGSGSYSYVRAYIVNDSPCAYKVSARCSFSFIAAIRSTGRKSYKTSVTLNGHLLDDYFTTSPARKDKMWTGPPTPASGGNFNLVVQDSGVRELTALIEPGVKYELYHIYPQIAFLTGGIWSGDPGGFGEALGASCTISILETYNVYSIQLK